MREAQRYTKGLYSRKSLQSRTDPRSGFQSFRCSSHSTARHRPLQRMNYRAPPWRVLLSGLAQNYRLAVCASRTYSLVQLPTSIRSPPRPCSHLDHAAWLYRDPNLAPQLASSPRSIMVADLPGQTYTSATTKKTLVFVLGESQKRSRSSMTQIIQFIY